MKKLIIGILILSLFLSGLPLAFSADEIDDGLIDEGFIEDTGELTADIPAASEEDDYYEEPEETELIAFTKSEQIEFLLAMKIITGESIGEPSEFMSRGEFASLVARSMNYDKSNYVYEGISRFSDVAGSHLYASYIDFISKNKIIDGETDGNFYPDRDITYNEVIKMLVSLTGYREYAEARGGYPSGYILTAANSGLSKGISGLKNGINRNDIYIMLYNALNCDIFEQTVFGSSESYNKTSGLTVLSEYMNIYKYTGIMNDNGDTGLDKETSVRENEFSVISKGEVIKFTSKNIADKSFIGQRVILYAEEYEDKDEKLTVFIRSAENDILTIPADRLAGFDGSKISYYIDEEKTKIRNVSITPLTDKIYNGVAYPNISDSLFIPESGDIRLIDNNADGKYDVAIINSFVNIYVETVNTEGQTLRDKYDARIFLDLDPENTIVRVKSGLRWIDFDTISAGDVVSVAVSETKANDKKLAVIHMGSENIRGVLSGIDNEFEAVYLKEQKYKLTSEFKALADKILTLGAEYTFLLNFEGKIAGVKIVSAADKSYMLLISASVPKSALKNVQLKVLGTDGEIKILELSDKVTLNDGAKVTAGEILDSLKGSGGEISPQVIRVKSISDNVVSSIYIAEDADNTITDKTDLNTVRNDFDDKLYLNVTQSMINYKKLTKSFDGYFTVNESTMIFKTPTDLTREEDYEYFTHSKLPDGAFDIKAYNVDEQGVAKVVLITKETWFVAAINYADPVGIVERKTTVWNPEKEEYIRKLYYYLNGSLTSFTLPLDKYATVDGKTEALDQAGTTTYDQLKKGDIIRFTYNPRNNEIWYLTRHFDIENKDTSLQRTEIRYDNALSQDFDYSLRFVYGQCYSLRGGIARIMVKGAKNSYFFDMSNAAVYKFKAKSSNGDYISGSLSDITDYLSTNDWATVPYIFVKTVRGEVKEVFVYDFEE